MLDGLHTLENVVAILLQLLPFKRTNLTFFISISGSDGHVKAYVVEWLKELTSDHKHNTTNAFFYASIPSPSVKVAIHTNSQRKW